jgi:Uncharacterized conserved protein
MSDFDNIPDELKQHDQWLYWNASNDKPRKPLASPAADYGASWSNPDEWQTFEEVSEGSKTVAEAGIGFVNAANNSNHPRGIYGVIDLDGIIGEDGHPKDWVPSIAPFVDHDAYIEYSPSGEGMHIPIAGAEEPDWWSDEHFSEEEHEGVEYLTNKYATYTGDKLPRAGDEVVEWGDWIKEWLREAYKTVTGSDPLADRTKQVANDATGDSSSTPDEEWFVEEVAEEALKEIDSDCGYKKWRDIGMALSNRFGTSRGGRMFESWSRGSGWDEEAEDQADRIVSDARNYDYDAGTIIHYAQDSGWDATAAAREQLPDRDTVPDKPTVERVDEDSEPPESDTEESTEQDSAGITAVSTLDHYDGGYGYLNTNEDGETWFERVTNFKLDAESFLFKDGTRLIDLTVIPSSGEETYDITVPAKVFNDARRFRDNIVTGLTTTFEGTPSDLNELRKLVGAQPAPVRKGTHHMGLHPGEGEIVTPEGVITADGWTDDPEMAYIEREIAAERAFELSPETHTSVDRDEVASILELLPKTRNSDRFLPVLGWLYTAPFRPYVQDWEGQFNTLHVTGETGAGKSSTLSLAWQLIGMNGDPMACDDTKFALTTAMASTNSIPMWFDEYKPGDMKDWELDRFQTLMRKSTRGGIETRGNADKSTEEYRLASPLMISGEQAVQGAAEERRSIQTRFLETVKQSGSVTREAFSRLTGTAYEKDGETHEPSGYDLHEHAFAYHQFVARQDEATLKKQWKESREYVRDLLTTHGITGVDDLPRQGLQTIHFGLAVFGRFATEVGAESLPTAEEIDNALLYVASQFGDKGSRKSHLDRFLELASRAAAEDYIEEGQHYAVVNFGTPEEEVAIKLSRTFDSVSKYAQDFALDGEDMLNAAKDYRSRIKETGDKAGSYINEASQYTTGLNRCVRIDVSRAAEELQFEPEAFGATPIDDDTDESSKEDQAQRNSNHGHTAIATLAPGRDISFTAEIVNVSDGEYSRRAQGEFEGQAGSRLGWVIPGGNSHVFSARQGQTVRISKATLRTDQDGLKEVVVNDATEVEIVQPTADTQAGLDTAEEATTDGGEEAEAQADTGRSDAAATDGAQGAGAQLKKKVTDELRTEYGPRAECSVAGIAGALDADPAAVKTV